MDPLLDKVAVVTGGVSGIGLGIATALLEEGMRVAVTFYSDRHLNDARRAFARHTGRVLEVQLDVSDRVAVERVADQIERAFGKIHVLCNNAGAGIRTRVCDATYNDWDWALDVNVLGVANGIRCFLPKIRAHGEGGHIVTTASMSGLAVPTVSGVYATTKCAAVAMMEALRGELAEEGIGVSVYCPGLVHTNLHDSEDIRPVKYTEAGRLVSIEVRKQVCEAMSLGMNPREAGEHVVQGIRRNTLYILSHPEFESILRDRFDAVLRAVPRDPIAPAGRLRAEARTLSNPIYAAADAVSGTSNPVAVMARARTAGD